MNYERRLSSLLIVIMFLTLSAISQFLQHVWKEAVCVLGLYVAFKFYGGADSFLKSAILGFALSTIAYACSWARYLISHSSH